MLVGYYFGYYNRPSSKPSLLQNHYFPKELEPYFRSSPLKMFHSDHFNILRKLIIIASIHLFSIQVSSDTTYCPTYRSGWLPLLSTTGSRCTVTSAFFKCCESREWMITSRKPSPSWTSTFCLDVWWRMLLRYVMFCTVFIFYFSCFFLHVFHWFPYNYRIYFPFNVWPFFFNSSS